jgi:hypothetical protein
VATLWALHGGIEQPLGRCGPNAPAVPYGWRRPTLFSKTSVEDLRAILTAYHIVKNGSWPQLHTAMERRAPHWALAGEAELIAELEGYVKETEKPDGAVRVFWKLGPKFIFAGCNERFARDAGIPASELMGTDDFDARLPWGGQASKYRADDMEVFQSRTAKLDILERQKSATGEVFWVRVGKAPILAPDGSARGILGMYDILDDKTASKLFFARSQAAPKN